MRGGIIAAGEGSRFRAAGILTPKPLLRVGGVALVERTARMLAAAGVDEIAVIVNQEMADVADFLTRLDSPARLHVLVQTTASSMHSLLALAPFLKGGRFILATVDTIVAPEEVTAFVRSFRDHDEVDVLLGCTDHVDDEKPLRIAMDDRGRVTALGAAAETSPFVTAGLYGMNPAVFEYEEQARREGTDRLRNFLGLLWREGMAVHGHALGHAVDVDRPEDLLAAEALVSHPERA